MSDAEDKQWAHLDNCFNYQLGGGKVEYYGRHSKEWYPMRVGQLFNMSTEYRRVNND